MSLLYLSFIFPTPIFYFSSTFPPLPPPLLHLSSTYPRPFLRLITSSMCVTTRVIYRSFTPPSSPPLITNAVFVIYQKKNIIFFAIYFFHKKKMLLKLLLNIKKCLKGKEMLKKARPFIHSILHPFFTKPSPRQNPSCPSFRTQTAAVFPPCHLQKEFPVSVCSAPPPPS